MKRISLTILGIILVACATAQNGEKQLNSEYQAAIRRWVEQDVAHREQTMQQRATQYLVSLPNNEKLYDETYISIGSRVTDGQRPDGTPTIDYVFDISYNCKHEEGYTDDYPLGIYDWQESNSVKAICRLTKMFVEGVLDDIFRQGKEVTIDITSTTDGTDITSSIPYNGEYGDFRYMPTNFNGEPLRISVSRESGITNNAQLAYIRAQSVRTYLEQQVRNLSRTENHYEYHTRSYADTGAHYRRSSIELTVHDAFRETVDLMTADKIQDDYVDFNIPKSNSIYEDGYALIICNDEYTDRFMPSVQYGQNDAEMVKKYLVQALGIPERQVKLLRNATRQQIMQDGIHWLTDLSQALAARNAEGAAPTMNVFIYYIGHGYTDFNNTAYIVPNGMSTAGIKSLSAGKKGRMAYTNADGSINYDISLSSKESTKLTAQLIGIDEMLGLFKGFPINRVTLVADAGFNGRQRNGNPMLRADRKIDIKRKSRKPNLRADAIVMLAADYDRTAFAFDAQHHGFLTYFLLKEIKSTAGRQTALSYGEIYDAVGRKMGKESALQGRWQEVSGAAGGKWKTAWEQCLINDRPQ